jgi:hypothetical protein
VLSYAKEFREFLLKQNAVAPAAARRCRACGSAVE